MSATASLAADGSLAGLVSANLDPTGSSSDPGTPGSVTGTLSIAADTSGIAGVAFPSNVAADVTLTWADISSGTPTISAPNLATLVGKFQNMSLRDLADGLAQVAVSLTGIQQAKFDPDGAGPLPTTGNLDLPFLRGTVSDAVKANQVLVDFLKANVVQQPDPDQPAPPGFDATTVGNPTFDSLQDLIGKAQGGGHRARRPRVGPDDEQGSSSGCGWSGPRRPPASPWTPAARARPAPRRRMPPPG